MASLGGVPLSRIAWDATFGGKSYGILGPVFLLAPTALLSPATPPSFRMADSHGPAS
jgi:hypothetical protein